jgi:hypothetical protein
VFIAVGAHTHSARIWRLNATNAGTLAQTLANERDRALLFRTLATLRTDIALFDDVDELQWEGPKAGFEILGARLDMAVTGTGRHANRRSLGRFDSPSTR